VRREKCALGGARTRLDRDQLGNGDDAARLEALQRLRLPARHAVCVREQRDDE